MTGPYERESDKLRRRTRAESIDNFRDLAACRGKDPNLFYPKTKAKEASEIAKRICAGCPVFEECREHANNQATREHHGIWAGETVDERDTRRRREARQRARRGNQLSLLQEAAQSAQEPTYEQRMNRQAFGGLM